VKNQNSFEFYINWDNDKKEHLMKRFISFSVFLLIMARVFAQEGIAEPKVKLGVTMDAVTAVQIIDYNHAASNGEPPISDPVVVGGFGRENGNRSKLNLSFTADYADKAGLYADISFFPWWQDNRDQDLLINIGAVELGQFGGWIRPLRWFTINAGRFELQKLRGKVDGYNWRNGSLIGAKAGGFDSVFTEFDGANALAVEIDDPFLNVLPVLKGLYIGGMIYNMEELGNANNQNVYGGYTEAKFMIENVQFALGYTIENIGLARVQYIGVHHVSNIESSSALGIFAKANADDNTGPRFQAAFTFDSPLVPGLIAELGGTMSLKISDPTTLIPGMNSDGQIPYEIPLETKGEFLEPHRIAAGVQYDFNSLGIPVLNGLLLRLGGEYNFGGYSQPLGSGKTEYAPLTKIWFSPSYRFTNSFKVLADLGINVYGNQSAYGRISNKGGTRIGAGVYGQFTAFGNSFIRMGVVYSGGYSLGQTPVEAYHLDDLISFPVQLHLEF
jgi:hypothetical protein